MSATSPPELLAPAGDWECARAAVANGADAVYFGIGGVFNARARAAGFSLDDLAGLLEFLHRRGVCGYVTLNTLAFSGELESLEKAVRRIAEAGADAVLVQDLGLARLIGRVAPTLPIQASTQMTLTSAEGIAVAERLGIRRVVLARELSIDQIAAIHRQTPMPLEVFVHGAICVAYSGQCLTSESLGGRSANRGQCAQACRLPYALVADGRDVDLGERKYLLSPQDLAAYALVPKLIQAGVSALKIEGRLKSPEYVANVTRYYRQAIDAAVAGKPVEFTARQIEEMEISFSRGFSHGWLEGPDHKALVPAVSSAKRGVLVGRVKGTAKGSVRVALSGRIKPGDGVVFEGDRAAGGEQGGRVFTVSQGGRRISDEVSRGLVDLGFQRGAIDFKRLRPGQNVWKTDDPALARRLRKSFSGELAPPDLPVEIEAQAAVGGPLRLVVRAEGLPEFACASDGPLAEAIKHPLTEEVLQQQLGRLGGTGFALARLEAWIEGRPMAPLSLLGKLRRELVAGLQSAAASMPRSGHATSPEDALAQLRRELPMRDVTPTTPQLAVLCRSLDQLRVVVERGPASVYADFRDLRQYGEAVSIARSAGVPILLATPRIQKPGEMGIFHAIAGHAADGVLVRNLAGLAFFAGRSTPCVADFSLNAANELSVAWLVEQGARRVTASYDLNRDELVELASHGPAGLLEVVVHQHMPMFHMEHCVYCATLSQGRNKSDCGRPCDRHEVRLRDRLGVEHPASADVGCRNTVFNAVAQSGAEVVEPLLKLGVRRFRVELLREEAGDDVRRVVDLYGGLIAGNVSGRDVWTALKAVNRVGVTRGTLEHRRDPLGLL